MARTLENVICEFNGGPHCLDHRNCTGLASAIRQWAKERVMSEEEIVSEMEKTIKEQELLHIDKPTNYQVWKRLATAIRKEMMGRY